MKAPFELKILAIFLIILAIGPSLLAQKKDIRVHDPVVIKKKERIIYFVRGSELLTSLAKTWKTETKQPQFFQKSQPGQIPWCPIFEITFGHLIFYTITTNIIFFIRFLPLGKTHPQLV